MDSETRGTSAHLTSRKPKLSQASERCTVDLVPPDACLGFLTDAERDVVVLLIEGLDGRDIAARRSRSRNTVANQIASAFDKLGVSNRYELAARVAELSVTLVEDEAAA